MTLTDVNTYIGQKGFSIYKKSLTSEELEYIRNELMVKPFIAKSPVQPQAFPIYRESNNKIYVPRYFGINTYGDPDEYRLSNGIDINTTFSGELRDYQINIVNVFLKTTNHLVFFISVQPLIQYYYTGLSLGKGGLPHR